MTQKNGKNNAKSSRFRLERVYVAETAMSLFVLSTAAYGSFLMSRWTFCIFLMLQGRIISAVLLLMRFEKYVLTYYDFFAGAAFIGVGLNFVDSGALLGRGVYKIDPLLNRLSETLTPRKKGGPFRRVNTAPCAMNV